jgi:hypothetical protein
MITMDLCGGPNEELGGGDGLSRRCIHLTICTLSSISLAGATLSRDRRDWPEPATRPHAVGRRARLPGRGRGAAWPRAGHHPWARRPRTPGQGRARPPSQGPLTRKITAGRRGRRRRCWGRPGCKLAGRLDGAARLRGVAACRSLAHGMGWNDRNALSAAGGSSSIRRHTMAVFTSFKISKIYKILRYIESLTNSWSIKCR